MAVEDALADLAADDASKYSITIDAWILKLADAEDVNQMTLILQEGAHSPREPGVEELITQVMLWLKLGIETFGAVIIGIGILVAVYQILRALVAPRAGVYYGIRLRLSRFLALALEFQLAADIVGTAISPSWAQLGKLGSIAVLRTALNFFLEREMKEEEEEGAKRAAPGAAVEESPAS